MTMKPGTWVGAERWPNRASHPNFWGKPHAGQVLDVFDCRAWANSLDFPVDNPPIPEVVALVSKYQREERLVDRVPVLWTFDGQKRVLWERLSSLRPYAEDVARWRATMNQYLDRIAHPRRQGLRKITEFLPENLKAASKPEVASTSQ